MLLAPALALQLNLSSRRHFTGNLFRKMINRGREIEEWIALIAPVITSSPPNEQRGQFL